MNTRSHNEPHRLETHHGLKDVLRFVSHSTRDFSNQSEDDFRLEEGLSNPHPEKHGKRRR